MSSCFFVKERRQSSDLGHGGNLSFDKSVVVKRCAAIGDCLAATCVVDRLIDRGYSVVYQAHAGVHCVLRRCKNKFTITEPNGFAHIDLDGAYENDPQRKTKHFSSMFLEKANEQLRVRQLHLGGPYNCKPRMNCSQAESRGAQQVQNYPRPWVFICPRSNTYNVRNVPDGIWQEAAARIHGSKFWLGNHGPAPPGIVDLGVRHLDNLIVWMSVADLVVSVDTGPMHIAAAMGIPIVAISQSSSPELPISDQCDYVALTPPLNCLNCQQLVCPINQHVPPCQNIDPELIASWANARLRSQSGNDVSAVVAVYKPDVTILNRCLESLVAQVSEIFVVRDTAGLFPAGALQHQKVRYITKGQHDIGYGRRANFGARHTNGRWILFCNDDAWLEPGAVGHLLACTKEDTGISSPMLYYPNKTIYHAGKVRSAGARGWGHIDHRRFTPTFTGPTELENVCGAVMLVRRQAFYDADGFDEDFYLYAEDDALCLAIRAKGYKILFTPLAVGYHSEHLSTSKTPDIVEIMHKSNALFGQKWSGYFDHNANRLPLGNFDYRR
jgi:GT2 family glycosyltransferase